MKSLPFTPRWNGLTLMDKSTAVFIALISIALIVLSARQDLYCSAFYGVALPKR
jgi:hypothetical protein